MSKRCDHDLVISDKCHHDGRPFEVCRHCGQYGTVSGGYSRGGGHRLIMFKIADIDAYIEQERQDTIDAMRRRAEHDEAMIFEVCQRQGWDGEMVWGVAYRQCFTRCGNEALAEAHAENRRAEVKASAAREWAAYHAAIAAL